MVELNGVLGARCNEGRPGVPSGNIHDGEVPLRRSLPKLRPETVAFQFFANPYTVSGQSEVSF